MAFKRQHDMLATFSMASMTDVIFLLLIFFMVTSTFVFPTALELNLPDSAEQTAIKPGTRIYIDQDSKIYASVGDEEPQPLDEMTLVTFLQAVTTDDPEQCIALYADAVVPYGDIVKVLNIGAENNFKMVLATKPAPTAVQPTVSEDEPKK